ncbi:hypothetical protein vseg_007392 [Gypsophila vaccaria]
MFLTFVYAFNGIQDREPLWKNLIQIARTVRGPWVIGGDFNCVISPEEIVGGQFQQKAADPLRDCIHSRELIDSPAMGAKLTWNNKQCPDTRTYRKLDRMLVIHEWLIKYDQYVANFLPEGYFDHTPCIVHQKHHLHRPNRPFIYFNMWSKYDRFPSLVQQVWDRKVNRTTMFQVVKHLKDLKPVLKKLNRDVFNDIEGQAGVMLIQLEEIQAKLGINPSDTELQQ